MHQLAFIANLTESGIIEGKTSVEKLYASDWPMDMSVGR